MISKEWILTASHCIVMGFVLNFKLYYLFIEREHLIDLLAFQHFQIMLTPRMFPVRDFVVEIFAQKALLNMGPGTFNPELLVSI